MTDVCSHVDCCCSEPREMVVRRLRGVDYRESYCLDHDPLTYPSVADMWQRPQRQVASDD